MGPLSQSLQSGAGWDSFLWIVYLSVYHCPTEEMGDIDSRDIKKTFRLWWHEETLQATNQTFHSLSEKISELERVLTGKVAEILELLQLQIGRIDTLVIDC